MLRISLVFRDGAVGCMVAKWLPGFGGGYRLTFLRAVDYSTYHQYWVRGQRRAGYIQDEEEYYYED